MQIPQDAVLLRALIGEAGRAEGRTLHRAIVEAARTTGLAGATVLRGSLSFGQSRRLNADFIVEAPGNLPVLVEIIDIQDRIHAFLLQLGQLIDSGLVTLEDVRQFRCGRQTHPEVSSFSKASAERENNETRESPMPGVAKMDIPHEAILLRIFTSADDRYGVEEPLYRAIVMKARELDLAGSTVLKGSLGFGRSNRLHEGHVIAPDERPVVIDICDSEERINRFLPVLDEMMESGLVTLQKTRVLQYNRRRPSYFERLKKSLEQHLHVDQRAADSATGHNDNTS
jgi:PII-like signaling protein